MTEHEFRYRDLWFYCKRKACLKPLSLETMTERCQAGAQRWGNQPPPAIYGGRQATMAD